MSDKEDIFRIRKGIVFREEDDGAFLFDPNNGRICYLNEVGIAIWKMCDNHTTEKAIIRKLYSEYGDVSEEKISEDCSRFIDNLKRYDLLVADHTG